MCGRATLAMEVSRTSMKVARVTVRATAQGLWWGFQTAGVRVGLVGVAISVFCYRLGGRDGKRQGVLTGKVLFAAMTVQFGEPRCGVSALQGFGRVEAEAHVVGRPVAI